MVRPPATGPPALLSRVFGWFFTKGINRERERADHDMAAPEDGDDAAQRARLKDLSSALDNHRSTSAPQTGPAGAPSPAGLGQAVNLGFRVMSEFVASVVVGAVIGWAIDHWLGSSPVALILFIGLGTAAGFWNVYRIAVGSSGRPGGQ